MNKVVIISTWENEDGSFDPISNTEQESYEIAMDNGPLSIIESMEHYDARYYYWVIIDEEI